MEVAEAMNGDALVRVARLHGTGDLLAADVPRPRAGGAGAFAAAAARSGIKVIVTE
jgi:hypothetical protein